MVVKFILNPISFKIKDVGYPFRLNKQIIMLMTVFSNDSFDEYEYVRCNKQVIGLVSMTKALRC